MARTVEDVALLFSQMTGYDVQDTRSVNRHAEDYAAIARQPVTTLRVGIPRKPFFDDVDPQIAKSVEQAIAVIARLTGGIKDVTLPPEALSHEILINAAEVMSYHQELFEKQADLYTPTTRSVLQWCARYIEDPAQSTAEKLARYVQGRERLERQRRTIDAAFTDFDVLVLPTMKSFPPTIEAALRAESNGDTLFSIENTAVCNGLGLPAISVPCGFSSEGLPIGLMICGPRFSEGRLLALAQQIERTRAL